MRYVALLLLLGLSPGFGQTGQRQLQQELVFEVGEAVNTFGAELLVEYRTVAADSSVAFSPLSLAFAFFLLYKGSAGQTREELSELFDFGKPQVDQVLSEMPKLLAESPDVKLASRLYVDQGVELKKKYVSEIGRRAIRTVDFAGNADGVSDVINDWVNKRTQGLIPEIVPKGALDAGTVLVLANALYFKGSWQTVFDKDQTENGSFYGIGGEETVPFMKRTDLSVAYKEVESLDGVLFALPYKSMDFQFYLFLPNARNGWKEAEKKWPNYAGSIFGSGFVKLEIGTLKMPKWETEVGLENLVEIFGALGIPSLFSADADFSGITDSTALVVTDVLHKTKIIVNEEGTEAASATAIIVARSAVVVPPLDLTVDRPFLYFIVNAKTRAVLFQGTQTSIGAKTQ